MAAQTWNLISTADAAAQLRVNRMSVLRYYHSGILRGRKIGRKVMVEQNAVIALMAVLRSERKGRPIPPSVRAKQEREAALAAADPAGQSEQQVGPMAAAAS